MKRDRENGWEFFRFALGLGGLVFLFFAGIALMKYADKVCP